MDPVKVPLTKISRTINKISIEFSANRDILVIITLCVWYDPQKAHPWAKTRRMTIIIIIIYTFV